MAGLIRYGTNSQYYDFTQAGVYLQELSSNFGNKREMTRSMPYMDGVYRELGANSSPHEGGNIQVTGKLRSATRAGMTALRRDLDRIQGFGLTKLYRQESNPTEPQLYTYAEAQVRMGLDYQAHGDLFQSFTLNFSCPDPYWYKEGNPSGGFDQLGLNFFMGISKLGGETGGGFSIAASGELSEATATNNGNAPTVGRISIRCSPSESCQNPIVQRLVNGQVYDYVSYTGVLGNGDELVIDARGHSVILNGDNAYSTAFDFKHPRFLRIEPSANLIQVLFANATDAARVTLTFEDAYYGS
jgi:hypothetical protein